MNFHIIIFLVSIIILLLIIDSSNVVMSAPVPGACLNNCFGYYDLCESDPSLTPRKKIDCVEKRKKCIKKCNRALMSRLRVAVRSLS